MTRKETINVADKHGFIHEVQLHHTSHLGFSTAYYKGSIVAQVELSKIREPSGDDDAEWEHYEERYSEWVDEIKVNMLPKCREYFNNNQ